MSNYKYMYTWITRFFSIYRYMSLQILEVLNDGRLVSGRANGIIIIYNKKTYQPDIIIKEHTNSINCLKQLNTGILASCSDKTIKLFKIKILDYEIIQTLNFHKDIIFQIVELNNNYLVSYSNDNTILFYFQYGQEYQKDYNISINGACGSLIQTKENEICYSEKNTDNKGNPIFNNDYNNYSNNYDFNRITIHFFDLNERKIKQSISNISYSSGQFIMIKEDLLLIPGQQKFSIININHYILSRIIDITDNNLMPMNYGIYGIYGVCMLNQNMLLTGDSYGTIKQWRIEGDNLILISKKEKAHENTIYVLKNIGNGFIASFAGDNKIKIW